MRGMAIIATGDGSMTAMIPVVIYLAHDVAVGASRRIIRKVRSALSIGKCKAGESDDAPKNQEYCKPSSEGD